MDVSTLVLGGRSKHQVLQTGSSPLAAGPFASSLAPAPYKSIKNIWGWVFLVAFPFSPITARFPIIWITMPGVKFNKCLRRAVLLFKGKSNNICWIFNDNHIQIIKLPEKCSREYASVRNELQTGSNSTQPHFSKEVFSVSGAKTATVPAFLMWN